MKNTFLILMMLLMVSCSEAEQAKETVEVEDTSDARILLNVYEEYISDKYLYTQIDSIKSTNLRSLLKEYNITQLKAVFKNRYNEDGVLRKDYPGEEDKWFIIEMDNRTQADKLIERLNRLEEVVTANIEFPLVLEPLSVHAANYPYSFNDQWHLNGGSNTGGGYGIDIDKAWNINKGRNDIIIAVCDGGVDYNHPNLDPGDRSRVIAGYDTGNNDNDPMDDLPDVKNSYKDHGTHIAGIIGANPTPENNISGVMQNCKIMPVKMVSSDKLKIPFTNITVMDFSTTATPGDVADAIDYAVEHGAHVINLSYGFTSPDILSLEQIFLKVPLLSRTIRDAYYKDVLIVASMGNDGLNGSPRPYFPAMFPWVMAIGNTEQGGKKSDSSSIGSHISVAAPGHQIKSTVRGGGVDSKNGTSMSAPVVAGIAGLILSHSKDRGLNLTNDDVREIIERTAAHKPSGGFNNEIGHGIANAHDALTTIDEPNSVVHFSTTGGIKNKKSGGAKWIVKGDTYTKLGLPTATYFVDIYEVTKHVMFPQPFLSAPFVWMRKRDSNCLSFANPNEGVPYCEITNITKNGFDIRYAAYYVTSSINGQQINRWVAADPESANVDFTAVGTLEPVLMGIPSYLCKDDKVINCYLKNLPAGASIQWSSSNDVLTLASSTGTSAVFNRVNSNYDFATINATIICSNGITFTISSKPIKIAKTPYLSGTEYELIQTYCWHGAPPRLYINAPGAVRYEWTSPTKNTKFSTSGDYLDLNNNNLPGYYTYDMPRGLTIYVVGVNECGVKSERKEFNLAFQDWEEYQKWCHNQQINKPNPGGGGGGRPPAEPIMRTPAIKNIDKATIQEPVSIKIYNLKGQLVYQSKEIINFEIKNTNLQNGIYIIETAFKDGNITREKVLKN